MSITLNGTTGITTPTTSTTGEFVTSVTGFKNRLINGAMMIDQRNAGASVTPANGAVTYSLDRWATYVSQASKLTVQQTTNAPTGFKNSLAYTSSSAYSSLAGDVFVGFQSIEGLNCVDLGFGTANAQTVTLSFWARSSLTGTHSGALSNAGNTRAYPFSYTISAANTWEYKTITIPGDTAGTWLIDNSAGMVVKFNLGSGSNTLGTAGAWASSERNGTTGSVSLVGTSGATLNITGVQLEKGSTATSFDYRPYGQELALCQRYFWKWDNASFSYQAWGCGPSTNTTSFYPVGTFPVTMRASPSISASAANTFRVVNGASVVTPTSITIDGGNSNILGLSIVGTGFTTGTSYFRADNASTSYVLVSAEL